MATGTDKDKHNRGLSIKLMDWAEKIGVPLQEHETALLFQYAKLVYEANRAIRLTGASHLEEILRKHVVDSLAATPWIRSRREGCMADIGSGAGFPGMVLKIAAPGLSATLIESSRKKSRFIEESACALALGGIEIINARAERTGQEMSCRERFDIVVCRAVSHLSVITEYALPLLKTGGEFIAYKGPGAEKEASESIRAVEVLGGEPAGIKKLALPGGGESRALIFVRKVKPTPDEYPRREGTAKKRPIRN